MRSQQRDDTSGRRRLPAPAVITAIAALLAVAGVLAVVVGLTTRHHPPHPPVAAANPSLDVDSPTVSPHPTGSSVPAPATPAPSQSAAEGVLALPPSEPDRVDIPAIGVHTTLVDLGVNSDGTLATPTDFAKAGWFVNGTPPGSVGPAVIAGHVDNKSGPAVFYRLGDLKPGDTAKVTRNDGTVAVFTVQAVREYPKDAFPTKQVYNKIGYAGLRLITCGGDFNSASGHYVDNIVVFAALTSIQHAT